MAYTKQQWANDTVTAPYGPINATRLQHIEDGLDAVANGGLIPVLNVKTGYGAVGDNVADDTARIQAAFDDVPASGAIVYLPEAIGYSVPEGGLTCANPVVVLGAGPGAGNSITSPYWHDALSQINVSDGAVVALSLSAPRSQVRNLGLRCTGVPAAGGAGIQIPSGGGDGNRYRDISIRGFYINLDAQYGTEWFAETCFFYDHGLYGVKVQNLDDSDGGDIGIVNCLLYAGPTNVSGSASLRYESGGALRLVANKFNARGASTGYSDHCIDLAIADGANTGEIYIVGNGISTAKIANIRIRQNGTTGKFAQIMIVGNNLGPYTTTGREIQVDPATASCIANLTIVGNTMKNGDASVYPISLANVSSVSIAGNNYLGSSPSCKLTLGSGVTGLQIAPGDGAGVGATSDLPAVATSSPGSSFFDTTLAKWQYADPNVVGGWMMPRTNRRADLSYSASITPDARKADWFRIPVTNATAFTINAPTNAPDSSHTQELTIEVTNNSGGVMGTITWASGTGAFNFAGKTWTNPASGKRRFVRFEWNKDTWICTAIADADY